MGNKKSLVAGSNERCGEIYERVWFILKNEKHHETTSKEANGKWDSGKVIFNSGLYHKVAIISREECNLSSVQ